MSSGLDFLAMPCLLSTHAWRRYCPSGSISTDPTPGQPPPVPLAGVPRCAPSQDYKKAALEPVVARAFYERYIYPLLGSHQSVGIVPGTYVSHARSHLRLWKRLAHKT